MKYLVILSVMLLCSCFVNTTKSPSSGADYSSSDTDNFSDADYPLSSNGNRSSINKDSIACVESQGRYETDSCESDSESTWDGEECEHMNWLIDPDCEKTGGTWDYDEWVCEYDIGSSNDTESSEENFDSSDDYRVPKAPKSNTNPTSNT
ncbi:MAG: hypothetical protein OCD01_18205 [Fibrobacterales bacterium]